jgi:hypothetical protein
MSGATLSGTRCISTLFITTLKSLNRDRGRMGGEMKEIKKIKIRNRIN